MASLVHRPVSARERAGPGSPAHVSRDGSKATRPKGCRARGDPRRRPVTGGPSSFGGGGCECGERVQKASRLARIQPEGGMNFRGFLVPASANLSGLRLSDPLVPHRIIACVGVAGPRHLGRTRHVGRGSYRIQLVRARTRFRDACTCVRARGTK